MLHRTVDNAWFCFVVFITLFLSSGVRSGPGVYSDKIIFGQTAALDGPAAALGRGMNLGISAAFAQANKQGGVNGRQLKLVALDDGYEPDQAISNTKKLIQEKNVFALIGGVGTPTANATVPIISQEKVPFIAPFTGAEFLRHPFKRYVINVRGSYWQETEEWIARLTEDLNIERIAILYQDDTYGQAGLSGVKKALDKRGLSLVGEAVYQRNTTVIKSSLLKIRKTNPDAVLMVGAYKPCAAFIKLAKTINFNPKFINLSFVGSAAFAQELGAEGEGVVVSQVVPFPFDEKSSSLLVDNYQKAIKSYDESQKYSFVSLEGYISARLVIEMLKGIDYSDVSRGELIDHLYRKKQFVLDDLTLTYGYNDNQGLDQVYMTVLNDKGLFYPVQYLE